MRLFAAAPHDDTEESPPAFISIDEIPDELLDDPPEEEGDDRVNGPPGDLAVLSPGEREKIAAAGRVRDALAAEAAKDKPYGPRARARVVPFRRPIKIGMHGPDVVATKRALSHAGYLRWLTRWSLIAGPIWRAAVKRFQKQHKLRADGVYGIATHRKLVQLGHFDKLGARLMAEAPRPTPRPPQRTVDLIEAYMLWAYHNRDGLWYLQRRPMQLGDLWALPSWLDCSEFATRSYKAGGAPDPNGNHYNGSGYTGTLAMHGRAGAPVSAALNFYGGGWPFKHVTIGAGTQRCFSMGSSPGPLLLSVRYRTDYYATRVYL